MKKYISMILVLSAVGCAKGYYSAQPITGLKQTANVASAVTCDNAFNDYYKNVAQMQDPTVSVDQVCSQVDAYTQKYKSLDGKCNFQATTVGDESFPAEQNEAIPDVKCTTASVTSFRQDYISKAKLPAIQMQAPTVDAGTPPTVNLPADTSAK